MNDKSHLLNDCGLKREMNERREERAKEARKVQREASRKQRIKDGQERLEKRLRQQGIDSVDEDPNLTYDTPDLDDTWSF